jgi:hypothetical protein
MIERKFFSSTDAAPSAPPCITRIHVETSPHQDAWHLVVFCRDRCAGVLVVPAECGAALVDLLLPKHKRIEGGTRETD